MDSVSLFLLAVAGIFLVGTAGEIVFRRTNVPDVIWLFLAGLFLGPVFGVVSRPQLARIAPYFAAFTLVVILFEGGSRLRLSDLSRVASRSALLAVVGFFFSVLSVALLCLAAASVGLLPESWGSAHALLVGSILGGSSSIIIMPAMAASRTEPTVANLVSLESALTDALCVVFATALVHFMGADDSRSTGAGAMLAQSFGVALLLGLVSGFGWMLLLRLLRFSDHAYAVTLAGLLVLYVTINALGGSAALGILVTAVILGNAPEISKKIGLSQEMNLDLKVQHIHSEISFIVKSFFFTFMGMMLGPPLGAIAFGIFLGFALFAARVPAVRLSMIGSSLSPSALKIVTVSLPRGMAAGVLATLPSAAGIPDMERLPVIVFSAVFTTILIFAIGFPLAQRGEKERPAEAGLS